MSKKNLLSFLQTCIFLFVIIISIKSGYAQQKKIKQNKPNPPKEQQKAHTQTEATFENALLWEITSQNAKNTMYIMGTHHLYESNFLKNEPTIQTILPKIDVFVGEIHVDSLQNATASFGVLKYMLLENATLTELLTTTQYKKVDKVFKQETGVALSTFNTMKPTVIAQYIQLARYAKAKKQKEQGSEKNAENDDQNPNLDKSMDAYFQLFGKKNNKTIMGLESVAQQMEMLYNKTDLKKQINNLMDLVNNKNGGSDQTMEKMEQEYAQQNITELYHIIEKYSTPQEMDELLYTRNRNWFPTLTNMINSDKKHLVAVGAGHLVGKYGVLTMLKQAGYSLKPIRLKME